MRRESETVSLREKITVSLREKILNGSHVFNSANLHASTGQSTESRLSTRSRGLGTHTASSTELDVDRSDAEGLTGQIEMRPCTGHP